MKSKFMKRTVAMALALVLVMSTMVMPAVAVEAVSDHTETDYVANYKVYGTLSANDRTVTGTTQCAGYCDYISVEVTAMYKDGWGSPYPEADSNSHSGPAASVRVTTDNATARVVSAEATHEAKIGLSSWGPGYTRVKRDLNNP